MVSGMVLPSHRGQPTKVRGFLRKPRSLLLFVVLFVFIVISYRRLFFFPRPFGLQWKSQAVQQKAYALAPRRRPSCSWTSWHKDRYSNLSYKSSNNNIFIALNFHNNEDVLPTFFQELPLLLKHLGPKQVYISIYENGSTDKTPELLSLLGDLLSTMGTPHTIISRGKDEVSNKGDGHRINVLAAARNAAMEPLYSGAAARDMPGYAFDEMLFVNDIFFCSVDLLEVLYQKRTQGANQACAMDWGGRVVYDRWIIRAMSGRTFYRYEELVEYFNGPPAPDGQTKPIPPVLPLDDADRVRFKANLPMQVFSCWNGATVFDASAFLPPHNIRFRTSNNDLDEHGTPKKVTEKASECFLTSVDMWKAKMGKIAIVPKASVAYSYDDYNFYRNDKSLPASHDSSAEKIIWEPNPPAQVAMQDYAAWYVPERWAPWDEQ